MTKNKGCLFLIAVAIFFFLIVPIVALTVGKDALKSDLKATDENFIEIDGLSDSESKKVNTILKDCGFSDIKEIKHDSLLDNAHFDGEKGYRVESNGINNIILYLNKDNSVNIVKYADYEFYKQNKVITNIRDISLTNDEKSKLYIQIENLVKNTLKSPSTANFPNITKWKFGKNKDKIIVQSYVDSQNGFGATVRSDFQVTLSTKDTNIISFIFDGKEYIK